MTPFSGTAAGPLLDAAYQVGGQLFSLAVGDQEKVVALLDDLADVLANVFTAGAWYDGLEESEGTLRAR